MPCSREFCDRDNVASLKKKHICRSPHSLYFLFLLAVRLSYSSCQNLNENSCLCFTPLLLRFLHQRETFQSVYSILKSLYHLCPHNQVFRIEICLWSWTPGERKKVFCLSFHLFEGISCSCLWLSVHSALCILYRSRKLACDINHDHLMLCLHTKRSPLITASLLLCSC